MARKRNPRRRRRGAPVGRPARKKAVTIAKLPRYLFTRSTSTKLDMSDVNFNQDLIRLDNEDGAIAPALAPILLNQLPNYPEFQNLFAGYKINAVRYTFTPQYTNADVQLNDTNKSTPQCKLITCYDPFDTLNRSATGTTIAELNQMQNRKTRNLIASNRNKGLSVYFKLNQRANIDLQGLTDGYSTVKPRWCSTASADVAHFGPAMFLQTTDGTAFSLQNLMIKVETKFYLEMKQVK